MGKRERRIKNYGSSQKILLVGEGNFSFSVCLARAFGSASNMVATSLDSRATLLTRYWINCPSYLEELEERGCLVLHKIDVHNMHKHRVLKCMKFDVVIYNFPHAGHFSWLGERDMELIELHRELLEAFFKSAREMLSQGGEVHVTHRDDEPYNQWEVEKLALMAGLCLKEKVKFSRSDYPGYINKRGGLVKGNVTFPIKDCFTFKFCLENNNTESSSIILAFDGAEEINYGSAVTIDDVSDSLAELSLDSLAELSFDSSAELSFDSSAELSFESFE